MTPQQLEATVLAAVEQLRRQGNAEDDRIEFKREWPDVSKARQLAGAANRASGSYVIGIDERTGDVVPSDGADPATWGSQMASRFDQVPPELLRHINVYLEDGSSVTALLFSTERAPYVVKTSGGSPELEVPIREGTRTRSARRAELLRLLVPEVSVPPAVLLSASVSGDHRLEMAANPDARVEAQQESLNLWGRFRVFVEHTGASGVLIAAHGMSGELLTGELSFPLDVQLHGRPKDAPPPPTFGVDVRHDGVGVTGPGAFSGWLRIPQPPLEALHEIKHAEEWVLRLSLSVVGARLPIRVDTTLTRDPSRIDPPSPYFESMPSWSFGETGF